MFKAETFPGTPQALSGVTVEFRDSGGNLRKSAITGPVTATGNFDIDPGGLNGSVSVAPGRNQGASPARAEVSPGDKADFTIRNVPALVTVRSLPGTFVLLTKATYNASSPPSINYATGTAPDTYSAVVSMDGTVKLDVRRGTYYLTCWKSMQSNGDWAYVRSPASGSVSVGAVEPGDSPSLHQVNCPSIP